MPKIGRVAHGGQTSIPERVSRRVTGQVVLAGAWFAQRRIRIGLVMYLGQDDGTQNVPIWEHEPFGGPE